jgi:hypothetical protein
VHVWWWQVVVDNFAPHVMAKWGITLETLTAVKPSIVYASVSAFGHDVGPLFTCAFLPSTSAAASQRVLIPCSQLLLVLVLTLTLMLLCPAL